MPEGRTKLPIHESLRLAGERRDSTRRLEVRNPFDGSLVGSVPKATVAEIREAFDKAAAYRATLSRHERSTMQSEAIGRTRSAMSAVDADIRGHFASLQALSVSRSLELGNIPVFYDEAQRVLRGQPDWLTVRLALATETPLFDTAMRLGDPLAPVRDLGSFRQASVGLKAGFWYTPYRFWAEPAGGLGGFTCTGR